LGLCFGATNLIAQEIDTEFREEESAELSLEEFTDTFQESFFEALKQKGIENYDRAINLLLECKRIDADNRVVDHELAKVYLKDRNYSLAEDHAITALNAAPENLWYLNTLVNAIEFQSASFNSVISSIPYDNPKLKENLALIYYQNKNYVAAQDVLREKELSLKLSDAIEQQKIERIPTTVQQKTTSASEEDNPLVSYKNRIKELLAADNAAVLLEVSFEALEAYPSQPYFYYANGYALNKNNNHKAAIEVLESALDYMLDDQALTNKIYEELSKAHLGLNNTEKSNLYLSKIKPGF